MMIKPKLFIVGVGLLIGMLSIGIASFSQHTVAGIKVEILIGTGSFVSALLLCLTRKDHPARISLLIYLGIILAAIARISFDITFIDHTSHNLLPFELIYYTLLSLPIAFIGSYLAYLAKNMRKK